MEPAFRASMNWLHTWAGLILGGLLFTIFWMGTLSVFDREIDRWMEPTTRLPTGSVSIDKVLRPSLEAAARAGATAWSVLLPNERQPTARVAYRDDSGVVVRLLDPNTGAVLPDSGTLAATRFLYPFHYGLHLQFLNIGIWLVGAAAISTLALCVSGVVIHRRIFVDFFTLRPDRKPRRLILDLHGATGVLALPFHVVITLSGLIVFYAIYFPGSWQAAYATRQAFNIDAFDTYSRPRLNRPSDLGSLNNVVVMARRLWEGDTPQLLVVHHPGDEAAYVLATRPYENSLTAYGDAAYFDGATGALLHRRAKLQPVMTAQRFISGLHLVHFRHWTLRWLYFGLGLSGCVLIATGLLFWLETRRRKHMRLGLQGVRIVEGLTIGSVTGIVIATLSFFVVNRLLPLGMTFLGQERAALEVWTFFLVWLATFAHAWLRPNRAWVEQCWALAGLAAAAVLLNWITIGDHLIRSLSHRHLWAVAGMDLLLLVGAALAALTARKLRQRAAVAPASGMQDS